MIRPDLAIVTHETGVQVIRSPNKPAGNPRRMRIPVGSTAESTAGRAAGQVAGAKRKALLSFERERKKGLVGVRRV